MTITLLDLEEVLRVNYPSLYVNRFTIPNSEVTNHLRNFISLLASRSSISAEEMVEAYAQTCFEFLMLQEKFRKSGKYAAASQEEIRKKIYSDDEKARNYQIGLLLTYAWWENHYQMAESFYTHAVKNSSVKTVLEIGVGHAFFAYILLQEKAELRYVGIDISESSIIYAKKILSASHTSQSIEFRIEDATKLEFSDDNEFDLVICCEVLEHVEDPLSLGKTIRAALRDQGIAFVTTVCNLEAIDHIYLFRNTNDINELFSQAGLEVQLDGKLTLKDEHVTEFEEINYWAILNGV